MIQIGSTSQEMESDFLYAPGGFAWWYVDLITPEGDGLVLIWSYGLPFLPGYADSARRGRPQRPVERPSINLVLYEKGRASFYLLQEYGADGDRGHGTEDRENSGGAYEGFADVIGDSAFASRVADGRRVVDVALDCAIPGSRERLTGTVHVSGTARRADGMESLRPSPPHLWTPLTGPVMGWASLDLGGRPLARLSGRAYHDRNGGREPLHALGIHHWMWGRCPLEGRELIYYLLWPTDAEAEPRFLGIVVDSGGGTHAIPDLAVETGRERRGFGGIRWPVRLRLLRGGQMWMEVHHTSVVDNGPFYLRFQSRIRMDNGEQALGWGELCYPDRVDLARHRPLVRMRVHHTAKPNSVWLPLFAGPRTNRITRLLGALLSPVGAK
jgi:carotenoid 1,2-hydratase